MKVDQAQEFALRAVESDANMTFAGIVIVGLTLAVEEDTADTIIFFLKDLFSFPEEEFQFLYNNLLPEVCKLRLRKGTQLTLV